MSFASPRDLFRLSGVVRRDPAIDAWFASGDVLRAMVQPWFARLRTCGDDVREALHDGQPTACVGDVAFAYVDAFTAHASLGFFHGADLPDPTHLLEGSGKRMRHVKLRWGEPPDHQALADLAATAYRDIKARRA